MRSVCDDDDDVDDPVTMPKSLVVSYVSAVTTAVAVSLGGRALANKLKSPFMLYTIPCVAVVAAGVSNVMLMRVGELSRGIDVYDAKGNKV